MKTRTIKNLLWGLVLMAVLLLASHLEYKWMLEEIAAEEAVREDEAEMRFIEHHLK